MGSVNPLLGRSVLIVEDEPPIALDLHSAFQAAGASILAASTVKDALELIARAQICAAIVDVNLGGHDCLVICAALTKRSIPFMLYTGYSSATPLLAWPQARTVNKPADGRTLIDAIAQLLPSQN
jgi:CheY-like chemotaxis protein